MPMNDQTRTSKAPTDEGPLYILTCPSCDHFQAPFFITDGPGPDGRGIKIVAIMPDELAELQRMYELRRR